MARHRSRLPTRGALGLAGALSACGSATVRPAPSVEEGRAEVGARSAPAPSTSRDGEAEPNEGELSATLPEGCEAECRGSVGDGLVRALQRDLPPPAQRCYEAALKRDPSITGSMRLSLQIDAAGRVCALGAKTSIQDVELARCIDRAVRALRFPAPDGGCADVEVPLRLVNQQPG
jgi:hypothetical protein